MGCAEKSKTGDVWGKAVLQTGHRQNEQGLRRGEGGLVGWGGIGKRGKGE